ncbi:MAG: hypothetical protein NTY19_30530 [Planctomycetota bacterium]|nr:hypothetical protein [Planctomycetota bacterium]
MLMNMSLPKLALPVLLLANWTVANCEAEPSRTFAGLEEQLLQDAADGRWDEFSLFEAALIASGVAEPAQLPAYRAQFDQIVQLIDRETAGVPSERARARAILRGLHEHVLTGRYQATCTELDRTLDQGRYNCVTATILYRCLAARAALSLTTRAEPNHVYCRLESDPPVEIQTTSPQGFGGVVIPLAVEIDPFDGKPEACASSTEPTASHGMAGAWPSQAGSPYGSLERGPAAHEPRELTDVQLVAKIYFNRGLALLECKQFRAALHLLRISCRLDSGDDVARQNLLACLNNWALAEADAGQFRRAATILTYGIREAPDYRPFLDNQVHVYQRWVMQLCREGDFAEAIQLLESGYRQRPEVPLFAEGRAVVCQIWRQSMLSAGKPAAAVDSILRAKRPHSLGGTS